MTNTSILAADIGGTNARFAAATVDGNGHVELGEAFNISTRQAGVSSFIDFWHRFEEQAPPALARRDAFSAISLAVAGPVRGQTAELTNIDWNIRAEDTADFPNLFLLNDFLAQGHALVQPNALSKLEIIRAGEATGAGVIALVGAGTGLGHCAVIHPQRSRGETGPAWIASSEAGHAAFPFRVPEERELELTWLKRIGKHYLSNDDVVSGPGLINLHACLTGMTVPAGEALGDPHSPTSRLFARFYGRACMNYCLNLFPVRCLVISGGIAARNPHLLRSAEFLESFEDAQNYRHLLAGIPIFLNTDQQLGIRGAAAFAASKLRT